MGVSWAKDGRNYPKTRLLPHFFGLSGQDRQSDIALRNALLALGLDTYLVLRS